MQDDNDPEQPRNRARQAGAHRTSEATSILEVISQSPELFAGQTTQMRGCAGGRIRMPYLPGNKLFSPSTRRSANEAVSDHGVGCRNTWSEPCFSRTS